MADPSLYRIVANYTYDWESWHDPHGELIWVNDAVERITGYSVEECLSMPDYPLPIVHPEDQSRIMLMLQEAKQRKSRNDYEFRILTRNNDVHWMAVSWQPMFNDSRKHLGFRTSVRDITERQNLKEQLRLYTEQLEQTVTDRTSQLAHLENSRRQMEKMAALGELAAGVAHEINNPLAGIRNSFTLFKKSLAADHPHYDLLELVDHEIERISNIVHQMYQLYRRPTQPPMEICLIKILQDIFCLLEPIAERHQVRLQIESGSTKQTPQSLLVKHGEGELKQILFNVIRNAIQASPVDSEVTITIEADEKMVQLVVIDRGTGIDDETLPHIFEPFFSTKGHLQEGMGLGLFVTRNHVEAMDGNISVETEMGVGTTVNVSFPRRMA